MHTVSDRHTPCPLGTRGHTPCQNGDSRPAPCHIRDRKRTTCEIGQRGHSLWRNAPAPNAAADQIPQSYTVKSGTGRIHCVRSSTKGTQQNKMRAKPALQDPRLCLAYLRSISFWAHWGARQVHALRVGGDGDVEQRLVGRPSSSWHCLMWRRVSAGYGCAYKGEWPYYVGVPQGHAAQHHQTR